MKRIVMMSAVWLSTIAAFAELTDPGTYSATGEKPGIPAPVGTYVPTYGATFAISASVGYYVSTEGSSAQTPAPAGYYVNTSGASAPTPAPFGSYIPNEGSTFALQAPPGTFVGTTGASAPTPAPPGYYTVSAGASVPLAAAPGTYIPDEGSTFALQAPPGTFVGTTGASAPTPAPPGYYTVSAGASVPLAAAPGTYIPHAGSTSALTCPPGTTSYTGSAACRATSKETPFHSDIVGPVLWWEASSPAPVTNLSGTVQYDSDVWVIKTNVTGVAQYTVRVENRSADLGRDDPLTALTLLGASFDSGDAALYGTGSAFPIVLYEGESTNLVYTTTASSAGSLKADLTLQTDRYAAFGELGEDLDGATMLSVLFPADADLDGDGLLNAEEIALGLRIDLIDTDGDGLDDGFEVSTGSTDPLVDDSAVIQYVHDQRAEFGLYTAADIQLGSIGNLVLEPAGGGQYRLSWVLESTTNLVEGSWNPVSTNELWFTPEGSSDSMLFRIQVGH